MIQRIKLIRNLGQFDSVDSGRLLPLDNLALVYAENGRGKTTLAAVFRSLRSGNAAPILERHRLGAERPPHIVIEGVDNVEAVFQNGAWQRQLGDFEVFDDLFVAENVCSGMKVETGQRQNLHELIIGAHGVELNNALQAQVDRIEDHNRELRRRVNAIPEAVRGSLSVEEFCALEAIEDIQGATTVAERNLAAGRDADKIQRQPAFSTISLPKFDVESLRILLSRQLPDLHTAAATRVQEHVAGIGDNGETWIGDGMNRVDGDTCPFCAQSLAGASIIKHYQLYFSKEYQELKKGIDTAIPSLDTEHGGDAVAAFERLIAGSFQNQQFWSRFCTVNDVSLDTAAFARVWNSARRAVLKALLEKQAAPLERKELDEEACAAIARFCESRREILKLNEALKRANGEIALVKERAAAANIAALKYDLGRLRAVRSRFDPEIALLCDAYLAEKQQKVETEGRRERARANLDDYRENIFPTYQASINEYLGRFNAGFRLAQVKSVNTRVGSSCTYSVLINEHEVPISAAEPMAPCFKNTMSSGDRNTLALAFFFASLENQADLNQKIVIIDDPMTSLDEHRALTTVQEIRRVSARVRQVIVLSHSKPFLCALWERAERDTRSAMQIARAHQSSTFTEWDVNLDCITEHDRRHALVLNYFENSANAEAREVAAALRPILESFTRVAYSSHFQPGTLLGPFLGLCEQREGKSDEILKPADRIELQSLLEYANRFHHDTNAAWQTEIINDHELLGFCRRTLSFTRK